MVRNCGGSFQTLTTIKYLYSDESVFYMHNLLNEAKVSQNTDPLPFFAQCMLYFLLYFYFRF